MNKLIVLSVLAFVAVINGQFLSLPEELKNLIPADIQNALSGLKPEQIKLLQEVDKEHGLGLKLVQAVLKLREKIKQLPASASGQHVENYYLLLAKINKDNQKELAGKLIKGYEALKAEDKDQIKKLFPDVVSTLESPELHKIAGL